jgi:hypothetical protein
LLFFTASNPSIFMGGMLGESKFDILKRIPRDYIPNTALIRIPTTPDAVLETVQKNGFVFPVIFKPDIGERGYMVKRINNEQEITDYLKKIKTHFIIQELVDLPLECGVFYMRYPNKSNGVITSLVLKEMLFVQGDGQSTLEELILGKDRAKLKWETLKHTYSSQLNQVIPAGEEFVLNAIGNHCLGTKFINGEKFINDKLTKTFDDMSKQIDGFYFGRYDLRTASMEDLYNGKVKIMELNGCGAEPGHIYEPGYSLFKALNVLYHHWRNLFLISRENRRQGVKYLTIKEGWRAYQTFKSVIR